MIVQLENIQCVLNSAIYKKRPIAITSGGFDPIHDGHTSCIRKSAVGHILIAVVNGDSFLERKKGKAFMPLSVRANIVDSIKGVSYTIPYESEYDDVNEVLRIIRPEVYTKGGNYNAEDIREYDTCKELGIEIRTNVGTEKTHGSSDFIREWEEFKAKKKRKDLEEQLYKFFNEPTADFVGDEIIMDTTHCRKVHKR